MNPITIVVLVFPVGIVDATVQVSENPPVLAKWRIWAPIT